MGRTVSRGDSALWQAAMHDVRPLHRRARPPVTALPPAPLPAASAVAPAAAIPATVPAAIPAPLGAGAGIDRANAERLRRGRHPIEARLDLHGMTQVEAHAALIAFVDRAHRAERRCVLVITGRGLGSERGGILRDAVPRWLEAATLRRHILAIAPARPQHGGGGALYLLLRRTRAPRL